MTVCYVKQPRPPLPHLFPAPILPTIQTWVFRQKINKTKTKYGYCDYTVGFMKIMKKNFYVSFA